MGNSNRRLRRLLPAEKSRKDFQQSNNFGVPQNLHNHNFWVPSFLLHSIYGSLNTSNFNDVRRYHEYHVVLRNDIAWFPRTLCLQIYRTFWEGFGILGWIFWKRYFLSRKRGNKIGPKRIFLQYTPGQPCLTVTSEWCEIIRWDPSAFINNKKG